MTKQEMINEIVKIMKQVYTAELNNRKYSKLQYAFDGNVYVTTFNGRYYNDTILTRLGEKAIATIYEKLISQF